MLDPMSHFSIWFLAFPEMQTLDLTGPFEVFNTANLILDHHQKTSDRYQLQVVSRQETVRTSSGLEFSASRPPSGLPSPTSPPHTLLLPGGPGVHQAQSEPELVTWVQSVARSTNRVATVCTGAFIAGGAGLLTGKRVATHWDHSDELQQTYPEALVDSDALYVRDGDLWSSAGVTAGVDLALALVEEDFGVALAQAVARHLVVFLRRPGGQSQFAPPVWCEQAESPPIRQAQEFINTDPSVDLSIPVIARHVGVSARHFSRLFHQEVGQSPGRYVEAVRVAAARHHLEGSSSSIDRIASLCGFTSAEVLRRAFHRQVGTSPDAYRKHHSVKNLDQLQHSRPTN